VSDRTITVSIDLPVERDRQLRIAHSLRVFVEAARRNGATVELGPSPDETQREVDALRAQLEAMPGHETEKRELHAQIGRIEQLIRFRRLAKDLVGHG
jgi:hypothetical protein